jgi:hypothetical protein
MALCFLKKEPKKSQCIADKERKKIIKHGDPEAERLMAEAALAAASQEQEAGWSPLAVTGVVAGSMLAIGLMVVIIKRAKAKK